MKICIIKLGADGDVLRTLPLAKALKDKWNNAEITWITRGDIGALIENLPYLAHVKKIPCRENEKFDILYNFDTEPDALSLAVEINANKKYGFYNSGGYPAAFNIGAEYYLNTMFDDSLKKENTKTYQEMMFMAAELPYVNERYALVLTNGDIEYASTFVKKYMIKTEKLIGIHMGAGSRWPSKAWHVDRVKELIIKAKNKGYEILLLGGPNEFEKHEKFSAELKKEGINIYINNPQNTKRQFAALLNLCSVVVCSDSFAMHVALGLGKKTVVLFFVTSPNEVEGYGLLKKIVSPKLMGFFPEKSDEYDYELVKSIYAEEVLNALSKKDNT